MSHVYPRSRFPLLDSPRSAITSIEPDGLGSDDCLAQDDSLEN